MTADNIPGMQQVFYSYAPQDEMFRRELEMHLSVLKREGFISFWHDRIIIAGANWTQDINTHLETASVILLLISPNFLASDYCDGVEMKYALERAETGKARIIPILVRPCDWSEASFAQLKCLPRNGKPITAWNDMDAAWSDVADAIRQVIEETSFKGSNTHFNRQLRKERGRYRWTRAELAEKLQVSTTTVDRWERGMSFPSSFYREKLVELFGMSAEELGLLTRTEKENATISPQEQVISTEIKELNNPSTSEVSSTTLVSLATFRTSYWHFTILGRLFLLLKLYKKALILYEKALFTEPLNITFHIGKGEALLGLKRNNEALAVYEQAIHLAPNVSEVYRGQGKAFEQLARQTFDEANQQAQQCYEKAKQLGIE